MGGSGGRLRAGTIAAGYIYSQLSRSLQKLSCNKLLQACLLSPDWPGYFVPSCRIWLLNGQCLSLADYMMPPI